LNFGPSVRPGAYRALTDRLQIKTDFRSGQPKGFGFVQMYDYESQCKVLEQYEHFIDGRMTQVKIPNSRGREHDGPSSVPHHRPPVAAPAPFVPVPVEVRTSEGICTKMYVGRVPANFTQEEIRSFFDKEAKKFGHHAQVSILICTKRWHPLLSCVNVDS
jgi:RNA recognition motif-containing protein